METIFWKPWTAATRKVQIQELPEFATTFRKGTKWLRPELVGQRVALVDEKDNRTFATAEVISVKAARFCDLDATDHARMPSAMLPADRLKIMQSVYGDFTAESLTTVVTLGRIEPAEPNA